MEQIIFLQNDEAAWAVLRRMQQSTAQQLVLVVAPHLEQLRLHILLRLIRRSTAEQSQRLIVVSEDRLVQVLAERMGCMIATSLDDYHGLLPGHVASLTKGARRPLQAPRAQPGRETALLEPEGKATHAASMLPSGASLTSHPEKSGAGHAPIIQAGLFERPLSREGGKPSANLDSMLVDGYLPNPGATPGLDEADELADQDAGQGLRYEIADESHPDQAQRESEAHEAYIIARIRETSAISPEAAAADKASAGSEAQPAQAGQLHPMRTIDELIHERGRADLFEWLASQATSLTTETPARGSQPPAASADADGSTPTREPSERHTPSASTHQSIVARLFARPALLRRRNQRQPDQKTLQADASNGLAWTTTILLRRIGIAFILALSLSMTCAGLALLPSAQVSYRVAVEPYSETLVLYAQPGTNSQAGADQTSTFVPAVVAQFNGVLVAQASATGHQPGRAGGPQQVIPTQSDANMAASLLRQQLLAQGETALRAQVRPGDIAGPVLANETIDAFPDIGTPLPAGSSTFQVSMALHLREVLVRQQSLQQAVWTRINADLTHFKQGFTLAPGQRLALNVVASAPPATGTALPALRLLIQAAGTIMPAMTPEQARSAIAGMSVESAERYLRQQPGISAVSIVVLPKWLNRLPIFSARIRIKLES